VFYTQYTGTVNYFDFVYNPATPSLTIPNIVSINNNLPHGADGVVFNPQDHYLLVGANDGTSNFNEVNPNTGAVVTYSSTMSSLNVMVDASGTRVYMDPDPGPGMGNLAWAPLGPPIGAATTVTLTGDDTRLNSVIFVDATHAYYAAELGPRYQGQTGHVGIIDLTPGSPTFGTTTCFKTAGVCTVFNGVHGGVYDPFTSDLFIFGWNVINQINPVTGTLVASETVAALPPSSGNTFDQGAVDGFGHIFISWASNNGKVFFEDYSSGTLNPANFHSIQTGGGAFANIDDMAPIVGPGSQG
jgi:hypothetical protein